MESEHKKSKISLSKPEDIPTEQPEYNYDSISTNEYQSSQYYQQNQPQQNYSNTQYDQPRRLNSNIPHSYQQTNSPTPYNPPFQSSSYQQDNTILSDKKRTTAGVLCLLGFCCLGGLHRIYTGHIASGILYLCTGGLFGIGTIVDLIKLLRGTFYDKNGRQLRD